MGAKFCFFTDPAKLKAQSSAGAFGPLAADQGKDRFRVTHRHEMVAAGAPAIAVCDGILCVQTEISGALTLILKPSQTPPFEAPVVSYFIYKGIDPASLLSGDAVLDETHADANDLTMRVAAAWKAQNAGSLSGSRAGLGLDRDSAYLHVANDPASKIFADTDPVERLFTYPHPKFQLPVVKAGDRLGSFGAACGFEIVLLRLGYRPKLGFARRSDNVIEVPSLPAGNGGAPWQPDDYDYFVHWHAKEQALAYMDPAAYFGAFVQAKLYKSDGDDSDRVKGKDVYDEILATFANRNVAWLDIRNNYSYSYNLFGFYGDTLRFASRSDPSDSNDLGFRSGAWPLLRLEVGDVPGARRGSLHRTMLKLPAGLSERPAVMVSKGFATQLGPERPKMKAPAISVDSAEPTLLTPIRIAFPAAKVGGQEFLTASYSKVNLYEMPHGGPQAAAALNVAGGNYLDGVFRIRDLRLDKDFGGNNLRFEIYQEEVLVDLKDLAGPAYAASIAIGEDADNTTLFAFPSHFLPPGHVRADSDSLPGWADSSTNEGVDLLSKLARSFSSSRITKQTIQPDTLSTTMETVIVRSRPGQSALTDRNSLDHCCFIILPKADHSAMSSQIEGDLTLAAALPAFLTVTSNQTKADAGNEVRYSEIGLAATGFAGSGGGKTARHDVALNRRVFRHADV